MNSIYLYNAKHAKEFSKKIKSEHNNRNKKPNDFNNCEATFTEIIVYSYYLKLICEGIVKSLDRNDADYDLRIECPNSSFLYFQIMSIKPPKKISVGNPIKPEVNTVKTHLREYKSSAYQKLLEKIHGKQNQFSKPRENFAVIEINDLVAMDISVLSPIFDEPDSKYIKGIILFNRGNYNNRDCIINQNFEGAGTATVT